MPIAEVNAVAIDLESFQRRSHAIVKEREAARREAEEEGIKEAEAEHSYRKTKAVRMAKHRMDGKGVGEAEIAAEADAADHKLARDTAHVLRRAAEQRWAECERNQANLRSEVQLSEQAG